MCLKILYALVIAIGLSGLANSFTLDAVGYAGSELALNPASILVSGYGELVFEAKSGSALVVNCAYQNTPGIGVQNLRFDPSDAVKITSTGVESLKMNMPSTAEERYDCHPQIDLIAPTAFVSALQDDGEHVNSDSGEKVGVQIPEPTTAILGLIGCVVLGICRRR